MLKDAWGCLQRIRCSVHTRATQNHAATIYKVGSVFLVVAFLLACDSPDDTTACLKLPVSPQLKSVLYWGYVSGQTWVPNRGVEIGNIYQPIWYAADKILVNTGRLDDGVFVRGIFEVSIDPVTHAFRSVQSFAFPSSIKDFDYDVITGQFLITSFAAPDRFQTVHAHVEGQALAVSDTVLDSRWDPQCAKFVNSSGAVIFARSPNDLKWGFYYVQSGTQVQDSLVLATSLGTVADARGWDLAGGKLCFGNTHATAYLSTITVIDLDGDRIPRVIAQLEGAFASVRINSAGTCAIVCWEDLRVPGSVAVLIDLSTGQRQDVDIQIAPCLFPVADFAGWGPGDSTFSFSAGGFSGEQDELPRQLWINEKAFCR